MARCLSWGAMAVGMVFFTGVALITAGSCIPHGASASEGRCRCENEFHSLIYSTPRATRSP